MTDIDQAGQRLPATAQVRDYADDIADRLVDEWRTSVNLPLEAVIARAVREGYALGMGASS